VSEEPKLIHIPLKFKDPEDKSKKPMIDDFSLIHAIGGVALGFTVGNLTGNILQIALETGEIIISKNDPSNRFYEPKANKIADLIITAGGIFIGDRLRAFFSNYPSDKEED
jgi:hypothetical protein